MVEQSKAYLRLDPGCRILPQLCNAPSTSTRMESMHGIAQCLFNNSVFEGNIIFSPYLIGHRVDILLKLHNIYDSVVYTGLGKQITDEKILHKILDDERVTAFVRSLLSASNVNIDEVMIEATITPYSVLSTDFPLDFNVLSQFPRIDHKVLCHKGKLTNELRDVNSILSQPVNVDEIRRMSRTDFDSKFIVTRFQHSLHRIMSTSILNTGDQITLDSPFHKFHSDKIEVYPSHIISYKFDNGDITLGSHSSKLIHSLQTRNFTRILPIQNIITKSTPFSPYTIDSTKCDEIDQMADIIYNAHSLFGGLRIDISSDRLPLEVPKSFVIRSSSLVTNMLGHPFSELPTDKIYDMTGTIRKNPGHETKISATEAIARLQHTTDNLILKQDPDEIYFCKWMWVTYNNVHINHVPLFV